MTHLAEVLRAMVKQPRTYLLIAPAFLAMILERETMKKYNQENLQLQ